MSGVQGIGLTGRGAQAWSAWWSPLELARRWAGYARETGLDAVARKARIGDRLAAIEAPANRLGRVITEELQGRDEAVRQRLARWLVKGGRLDVVA